MLQDLIQPMDSVEKINSSKLLRRSRCTRCPRSKDVKTTAYCGKCNSCMCTRHLKYLCDNCTTEHADFNKVEYMNALDRRSQHFKINQSHLHDNLTSDHLCRTCLSIHSQVYSIFDFCYHSTVYINEMITSLCSVQIQKDDNLPKTICVRCIEDIKAAYQFKKNCERAEIVIKEHQEMAIMKTDSIKKEIDDPLFANFHIDNYRGLTTVEVKLDEFKTETDYDSINVTREVKQTATPDPEYDDHFGDADSPQNLSLETRKDNLKIYVKKGISTIKTKLHYCKFCDYESTESSNVKRHMRKHTNDRPYKCEVCNRSFTRSESLKEHLRIHSGEKPYLCEQCHYRSSSKTGLRVHKMNKHSQEKKFPCKECNYRAKTRTALLTHEKTHSGIRNFSCDLCPYEAIQLHCLERHKMMIHSAERPFVCDKCSYRCVSKNYLKIHQRTHLTIKRFSCDECPYTCHTQHKLKCHKRIHTGEKPYECDHCGFKSASMSSLKRHIKSHSESEIKL